MGAVLISPWVGVAVIVVILVGLGVRRRLGVCWTFPLYLGVVALGDFVFLTWPSTLTQLSWFSKELLITVLRFGLALELTYRTVRAFPTAQATVRMVLLGVLLLTLGMVFSATGDLGSGEGGPVMGPLITGVQPLVLYGSIWLLTGIAGVILWYRLPIHPLHKAILVGLVPYLLLFNASLNLIGKWGWEVPDFVINFPGYAWLLLLTFWAVVSWRRGDVPVQAPEPDPALRRAIG